MRGLLTVLAGVVAAGGLLFGGFVLAFRTKFRPVQDRVRRMNRRVLNPRQLRTAGTVGASASVVRHVGRRSGTPYRTPVVVIPDGNAFVVELPYGPTTDWVRNVLAAGRATVEHEGRTVPVARPEVVRATSVARLFPGKQGRTQRMFGITEVLRLHPETSPSHAGPAG